MLNSRPHDLSCNLGVPEQYSHPKFQAAVKTIFQKARVSNIALGAERVLVLAVIGAWC